MTVLRSRTDTSVDHSPLQIAMIVHGALAWSAPHRNLSELHDNLVIVLRTLREARIIDEFYIVHSSLPPGYEVNFKKHGAPTFSLLRVG